MLKSSRPHPLMSKKEIEDKQKLLKNKTRQLERENQRLRERLQQELDKQAVATACQKQPVLQTNHWLILGRTGYIFSNLSCGQVKLMVVVIGLHVALKNT